MGAGRYVELRSSVKDACSPRFEEISFLRVESRALALQLRWTFYWQLPPPTPVALQYEVLGQLTQL
jgi:hypothetical protein